MWIPSFSEKTWKVIGYAVLGLIVLGLVLFGAQQCNKYVADKKADKLKANVNAALEDIKAAQANKAATDVEIAVAVNNLQQATNEALEATNATDAARAETNKALANVNAAVAANRPIGTTAEDVKRQLDGLNIE